MIQVPSTPSRLMACTDMSMQKKRGHDMGMTSTESLSRAPQGQEVLAQPLEAVAKTARQGTSQLCCYTLCPHHSTCCAEEAGFPGQDSCRACVAAAAAAVADNSCTT
jgi:hypothetical protein